MNVARAKEIAESGEIVPVFYEETQVVIQRVDEKNETARIYPKDHPEYEQEVPLRMLHEKSNT